MTITTTCTGGPCSMPARHITVSVDGQMHELCIAHQRELTRTAPTPYTALYARRARRRTRVATVSQVAAWMSWHAGRLVFFVFLVAFGCALGANGAANTLERAGLAMVVVFAGALMTAGAVARVGPRPALTSTGKLVGTQP